MAEYAWGMNPARVGTARQRCARSRTSSGCTASTTRRTRRVLPQAGLIPDSGGMSRFPPANVRCTPGDSLTVEWEVDHFYPDSEDPQVGVIEVPALGWSRPFDPDPPSQDMPFGRDDIAARLHAANPGAP